MGHPPQQSRGWDTALRLALTLGVLAVDGGCTCSCTWTELSQRVWDAPSLPAQWRPGVSVRDSGSPSSSWVGGGSRPQWGEEVSPFLWNPWFPCLSQPWGLSLIYMEHLLRGFPERPWAQCPRLLSGCPRAHSWTRYFLPRVVQRAPRSCSRCWWEAVFCPGSWWGWLSVPMSVTSQGRLA